MRSATLIGIGWWLCFIVLTAINMIGCESLPKDASSAWHATRHINYIVDEIDHWKSPDQFIIDGYGDCEDFALFYYKFLSDKGHKPDFITGDGHAWVRNYHDGIEYYYSNHDIGKGPLPGFSVSTVNSHNKFKEMGI